MYGLLALFVPGRNARRNWEQPVVPERANTRITAACLSEFDLGCSGPAASQPVSHYAVVMTAQPTYVNTWRTEQTPVLISQTLIKIISQSLLVVQVIGSNSSLDKGPRTGDKKGPSPPGSKTTDEYLRLTLISYMHTVILPFVVIDLLCASYMQVISAVPTGKRMVPPGLEPGTFSESNMFAQYVSEMP